MRIIIIGGVAGGASCAARARRNSEDAEIILFERGSHVSFANCGLPYYVGEVITDEKKLLLATPDHFRKRFEIDVRVGCEVTQIVPEKKEIVWKQSDGNETGRESYDVLVLSPGAAPIRPSFPGIDLPGIFTIRNIPDSERIKGWIQKKQVKHVTLVGGGFIGLEMAENLVHLGLKVTLIEMQSQVMPPMDFEMVHRVHQHIHDQGVQMRLGDAVASFALRDSDKLCVTTEGGTDIETDMVLLAIGVRPENELAQQAGLKIGKQGGIWVDSSQRTSVEDIYAVGDAVEKTDCVTQKTVMVPLAGPANRQGRLAADVIFGKERTFRGVQGTAVCKIFDLVVAATGASEKTLKQTDRKYEKVYLYPGHHVGYYPGAITIDLKVLFDPETGQVLGAQAVGEEGVEKRIDVLAFAIQKQSTVFDLEECELCYAPQFGAAKDPVNMAGMIASNHMRGDAPLAYWEDLVLDEVTLLDTRTMEEYGDDHITGALHIPLDELRNRKEEIPRDKPVWVFCLMGQRGYYGVRMLRQRGWDAWSVTGGIKTYRLLS